MDKGNRNDAQTRAGEVAKDIIAELDHFKVDYESSIPIATPPKTRAEQEVIDSARKTQAIVAQHMHELKNEPFIAYVKCLWDQKETVFIFCRNYTPISLNPYKANSFFASYKSPLGRVIALDLDQQISVNGRSTKVLEKTIFKPVKFDEKWDGTDNQFNLQKGHISTESLRKLIELFTPSEIEELDEEEARKASEEATALEELRKRERVRQQSERRAIRQKLELIDRPILDQHQDKIFRLPLGSQIILTGAPGTGKTTTLVKRISQKSREEFLTEKEKKFLEQKEINQPFDQDKQWVMFTPSDLLKAYLKEAMNKEGIAEPNIATWETAQTRLARTGYLDILKVDGGSKGLFRLGRNEILARTQNRQLIQYTKRFEKYVKETVWKTCREVMRTLRTNKTNPKLLSGLKSITGKYSQEALANTDKQVEFVYELAELQETFGELREDLKKDMEKLTDKVIQKKGVLKAVVELLKKESNSETTQMTSEVEDEDEGESLEDFEGISSWERSRAEQYQRVQAVNNIKLAIAWYVEWLARDRKSTQSKKYWSIIQCMESVLEKQCVETAFGNEKMLVELGKRHLDLRSISPLTKGYEILLNRIPVYYNRFRRMLLREKSIYLKADHTADIRENKLSRSEIDLLIFIMLKNARSIFNRQRNLLSSPWLPNQKQNQILENIREEYRVQVLVDEATDFSSLQLGCMFFLSHPLVNSFVLSGDPMQRVTNHGLADWQECDLFRKKFTTCMLDKNYRQSARLLQVAKNLYVQIMKKEAPFQTVYDENKNDPPPLQFNAKKDRDVLAEWLAERISEIYKIHGNRLPSIAIFVPEESDIAPLYDTLVDPLNSRAFELDQCIDGKVGDGEKVRIFSVKYIKGLEFQGAFLVDVDKIQRNSPDLVDKYLYVGLTRAAEFLGITYNGRFPSRLRAVRDQFHTSDWNDYISV